MRSRNIIADLHNHSTASDGEYTPSELVLQAREIGLKAIALTDHDTIAGLDEAIGAGHESGIKVIPGIAIKRKFIDLVNTGTVNVIISSIKNTASNQNMILIAKLNLGPPLPVFSAGLISFILL